MEMPASREEVEEEFENGDVKWLTRADISRFVRDYFGLRSMVSYARRAELVEFIRDEDRRPSIMAVWEDRHYVVAKRKSDRREKITERLEHLPGRWRFAAIGRFAGGSEVDGFTGEPISSGIVIKDLRKGDTLAIAGTTATDLRRRRKLPYFDRDRLPATQSADDAGRAWDKDSDILVESLSLPVEPPKPPPPPDISDLLQQLNPEWGE